MELKQTVEILYWIINTQTKGRRTAMILLPLLLLLLLLLFLCPSLSLSEFFNRNFRPIFMLMQKFGCKILEVAFKCMIKKRIAVIILIRILAVLVVIAVVSDCPDVATVVDWALKPVICLSCVSNVSGNKHSGPCSVSDLCHWMAVN